MVAVYKVPFELFLIYKLSKHYYLEMNDNRNNYNSSSSPQISLDHTFGARPTGFNNNHVSGSSTKKSSGSEIGSNSLRLSTADSYSNNGKKENDSTQSNKKRRLSSSDGSLDDIYQGMNHNKDALTTSIFDINNNIKNSPAFNLSVGSNNNIINNNTPQRNHFDINSISTRY